MERDTRKGIIPCEGSQGNDLVQTKDRGLEQICRSQPLERIKPPDTLISDFLNPGWGGNTFLLFKPHGVLWWPWKTNTTTFILHHSASVMRLG